jgi:hypothetical protein
MMVVAILAALRWSRRTKAVLSQSAINSSPFMAGEGGKQDPELPAKQLVGTPAGASCFREEVVSFCCYGNGKTSFKIN